jgi:predicted exporter
VGQKVKKKSVVISAFTPEARLKRKIRAHLRKLGFVHAPDGSLSSRSSSKESIRALHLEQRRDRLKSHKKFVQAVLPTLENYFANGSEIEPDKIQPRLELIEADTWQSDLFRLASLSWSVPVSYGFGRLSLS